MVIYEFIIDIHCLMMVCSEGEYVDLSLVPERFTGYSGPSAHRLWSSIYEENCFGISELNLLSDPHAEPVTLPDTMTDVLREDVVDGNSQCLEKRVYYKIISGESLHKTTCDVGFFSIYYIRFACININPYL